MSAPYPNPPTVCEKCGCDFEGVMFEAKIIRGHGIGQWRSICKRCFHVSGCKLGLGFGKMYVQNVFGEYIEVRGKVFV
jgi:hypothetical protein